MMNRPRELADGDEAGQGHSEEQGTGLALESVGTFVSSLERGMGSASGPNGNGGQQGNGDLLQNLAPLEPLNMASLGNGERGENPGLRRVVVSEGSEEMVPDQGSLAGPVGGLPPMTAPQGRPMVYGPQGNYPFQFGHPVFPHGGMLPPPHFDPHGMMMPPGPIPMGWYGSPIQGPYGMVSGGNGVNPFWTPATQARVNQELENQPSGARRVLEGSFNRVVEREVGTDAQRPGGLGNETETNEEQRLGRERETPGDNQDGLDPLAWFRSHVRSDQKENAETVTDPVELFRIRCLREAEQKFTQGVERLIAERNAKGNEDGAGSFRTAPSEIAPNDQRDKTKGEEVLGRNPEPLKNDPPRQPPQHGGFAAMRAEETGSKVPKNLGGTSGCLGEVSSETLRTLDLPPLSQDISPLGFGDWLALVEPMMADISYSSGVWWQQVMEAVRSAYDTWLKETPLGRLKTQVELPSSALAWNRTEKRAATMLLQALPEKLRLELVSARKLTTPQIMFRLYCLYQPGGQAERTDLLRMLSDFKLTGQPTEFSGGIRQWLRWLNRCEELGLVLPDPMVLAGVLNRSSDVLGKTDPQTGFRLASVRQELQLDSRPVLKDVKLFAATPGFS